MNLSEVFIRRPIMTVLVMISILFFGLLSYFSLPVSDLPNVDYPTIEVSVSHPGASPETMANTVATPLEREFMTIEGLNNISSNSSRGKTSIILQFTLNKSMDAAGQDVQAAINRSEPLLPKNLPYNPTYRKVNPSATPILYYALTSSNMTLSELYDYSYTIIGQRLSMIEGISQVLTYGSPFAVRIQIDPEKVAGIQMGIDEITQSIQQGNVELPTGTLFGKSTEFTIEVDGQLKKAEGYNQLAIKNKEGTLVHIYDIGQAQDSLKDDKYSIRYLTKESDKPTVVLAVRRQAGENTVRVIRAIETLLPKIQKELPSSLEIHQVFNKGESIIESVRDVQFTLILAFLLVVSIIYLTLGRFQNTLIPTLVLPMTIFGTFSIMYILGFSLDILSLLALTLSIGFLIDDAIVVLENNVRHVQMKEDTIDAALKSSKEISFTVVSTSICLMAVFIPMLFMSGVIGRIFREFGITIVIAIAISTFVALSLTPMLCSRFLKDGRESKIEKTITKIMSFLTQKYEISVGWALRHRILMLLVGASCVGFSVSLFFLLPKDFLPEEDIGLIQGFTLAQDATSPSKMTKYQNTIAQKVRKHESIESVVSLNSYTNDNEGLLFIRLKPFKERQTLPMIVRELYPVLRQVAGVNTFLSPLPLIDLQIGTTARALYQYTLTSVNPNSLYTNALDLEQKMKSLRTITQVSSDLKINQPQLDIKILRDRASALNVDAEKIETLFSDAYSDGKISQINTSINQYDVIIETLPEFYKNPDSLNSLYVLSRTNELVPLNQIISITETTGPQTVNHLDSLSAVTISFNLAPGVSLGDAISELETLASSTLPSDVNGKLQGTADVFKTSFSNLYFLFMITIFIIYVTLGVLYENFIHPLTVLSALPPATLGGLLTLFIFRETISLYSFVGIMMLIGIVMKNGILMVDFANEMIKKENKSAYDAIFQASVIRFRPIFITSISTLFGALPIALGIGGASAQGRISLGLAVVGGLIISQILTLYLTPVVFYYLEKFRQLLIQKKA